MATSYRVPMRVMYLGADQQLALARPRGDGREKCHPVTVPTAFKALRRSARRPCGSKQAAKSS